jgi:hypothetical protein
MRHHTLIVCTDPGIEPELVADAVDGALARAPRDAVRAIRVQLPAALAPALPITARPQRLADRLAGLAEAADRRGRSLTPRLRVEVVPCRSIPALLRATLPVDALVLVGGAGRRVRRAARGVAPDVTIVPARRDRRRADPGQPLHEALPGSP